MKKVRKIVIYALVVAVLLVGAFIVKFISSNSKTDNVMASENKLSVEVYKTELKNRMSGDTYKSTLEAYEQGIISSKISAKVTKVVVENGQYVNEGDTIAVLDDQDIQNSIKTATAQLEVNEKQVNSAEQQLNSTQTSLEKLKINVDDAQRNYDREKALFDAGAVSQSELDASEKTLNTSKADYNSGQANIEISKASIESAKASVEAQKVNIEKLQNDLNNVVIKAPISGVISEKNVNVGQIINQGAVLAKINDISYVFATIQVPQEKINDIKVGKPAEVTLEDNNTVHNGTLDSIDLSGDSTLRVFNCKIKMENSNKELLPGEYAKVNFSNTENNNKVITIPVSSLAGSEGDYYVFINDNGVASKVSVDIGDADENNVEIISGVKEGDEIICTNMSSLKDGCKIDVISTSDDTSIQDADKNSESMTSK
ncbi:efflux RND transporter periplasmic adaptor subunit [Clostridium butyricum]|uniref:efflux RND transporter periplasmic adaptor subunit n=2 Tax=Clostridium butyricum TaxID=1492 RepID=UPI0013CFA932|nr:efflux RND transporter periplasmic adaptor subunit [Clostridium butyricum]MCQ2019190.1 efflux RND transporter periplasmic adaptor subunit [Clostridium butyricum]MCQ2022965.1 efflux RND transporter periplasmic adaptor subunit [Clostridium butyricum]MDU6039984.1 efflux RND transporter periplasmic adaptor subunit [Clostridium butyricum]NFB72709.1 efflux RND transporter periplasmic adaptor subunit [Clostridium butyricum]NFB92275.1 efflux RND transporter periplasmic adaptor subunit [Clostridium 